MSTTLGEELSSGRELRCRYLRRDGNRCPNPAALLSDADPQDQDVVLLCPKHMLRAAEQFKAARLAALEKEAGR